MPHSKGTVAMVSHFSGRIKRVNRSTFAAELYNQVSTLDLGEYCRKLFEWMWGRDAIGLHMRTDCESVMKHVHSARQHPLERRLNAEVDSIREALFDERLKSFEHVPSRLNVADALTRVDKGPKAMLLLAMRGRLMLDVHDPLVTGKWRPKPSFC